MVLGFSDHTIWALAQDHERALVTINDGRFTELAGESETYCGLIVIPSGAGRDGQLDFIAAVVRHARERHAVLETFRNERVQIEEDGSVSVREVTRATLSMPASRGAPV